MRAKVEPGEQPAERQVRLDLDEVPERGVDRVGGVPGHQGGAQAGRIDALVGARRWGRRGCVQLGRGHEPVVGQQPQRLVDHHLVAADPLDHPSPGVGDQAGHLRGDPVALGQQRRDRLLRDQPAPRIRRGARCRHPGRPGRRSRRQVAVEARHHVCGLAHGHRQVVGHRAHPPRRPGQPRARVAEPRGQVAHVGRPVEHRSPGVGERAPQRVRGAQAARVGPVHLAPGPAQQRARAGHRARVRARDPGRLRARVHSGPGDQRRVVGQRQVDHTGRGGHRGAPVRATAADDAVSPSPSPAARPARPSSST